MSGEPFLPGPYRVAMLQGGPAIVAPAPEGIDPNAPGGMLRIGIAVHMPGVDPESEIGTMRLQAASYDLLEIAEAALEWIDAVPKDTVLPPMPGFDREWADRVIAVVKGRAPPDVDEEDVPATSPRR